MINSGHIPSLLEPQPMQFIDAQQLSQLGLTQSACQNETFTVSSIIFLKVDKKF